VGALIYGLLYQYQGNSGSVSRWERLFPASEEASRQQAFAQQQAQQAQQQAQQVQQGQGSVPQQGQGSVPQTLPPAHDIYRAFSGEYRVTAAGVSDTQNRMIKQNREQTIWGIVSQIPYCQTPELLHTNLEALVQSLGVSMPDRRIGTEEDWQARDQLMQQVQAMQQQLAQQHGTIDQLQEHLKNHVAANHVAANQQAQQAQQAQQPQQPQP
jgi:hypothetical protein